MSDREYSTAPHSSALYSHISNVLSASYVDVSIRDSLDELDSRSFQNTQDARRNLRLDLQQEVIQCNREIIRDFGQVVEQVKKIGAVIETLNKSCAEMRGSVTAATREAGPVLDTANKILEQRAEVESKQHVLCAIKQHFIISDKEISLLHSSLEPVNGDFFRVLARVKRIHRDSEVLLGTENERLGLEILEYSSKQLSFGFQKLHRWTLREFKTLDLENLQISALVRRSLRVLAEKPALFQDCMDYFAEAREQILSDSFFAALTGSAPGPNGVPHPKPIEFQAHEPLRYIGDMLAWSHSATVSEREALEVLFIGEGDELAKGIREGINADLWSRGNDGTEEAFDGRKALDDLVGRDIAGVAGLLRQRIEEVILSHEDAILAYKISNLLGFYRNTFTKLVGRSASILDVLGTLETYAQRQFRANMRDHIASISVDLSKTPDNLLAPEFLGEALQTLEALMQSYDTSLAAVNNQTDAFQPVLDEALHPLLKVCETLEKHMAAPSSAIFGINCLTAVKGTLASHVFATNLIMDIDKKIEGHATTLVNEQYRYFLETSGLQPLVSTLSSLSDSSEDLSLLPSFEAFQEENLVAISQTLDDFLPSAHMDAMENIRPLRSQDLAREITEKAVERFCKDFEMVEAKLLAADDVLEAQMEQHGTIDAGRMPPRLKDLFPRSSGDLRLLLS